MKILDYNKPLMLMAIIAGSSMNAIAFDTDKVQENQTPFATQFEMLDADKNALLTWPEVAKDKTVIYKKFIQADKDSDHTLDMEEYATLKTELGNAKVGQVVKDSVITANVKTQLLAEKNLKSLNISVETFKGKVILSGFVDSNLTKKKAEKIALNVTGVKSVENGLVVNS